jgi:hypothetical protein
MSQEGALGWYSMDKRNSPEAILRCVNRIAPVESIGMLFRTNGPDNEWEIVSRDEPNVLQVIASVVFMSPQANSNRAYMRTTISVDEFIRDCGENHCMSGFTKPGVLEEMGKAMAMIPDAVRGNRGVPSLSLTIGWHDIIEYVDDARLIARPWFSISFWDYGTPSDLPAFRDAFYQLPFVQRAAGILEEHLGPMERFDSWNV